MDFGIPSFDEFVQGLPEDERHPTSAVIVPASNGSEEKEGGFMLQEKVISSQDKKRSASTLTVPAFNGPEVKEVGLYLQENVKSSSISSVQRIPSQSISCELCNASFTARKNLLRHMRTIHGDASKECLRCRHVFARLDVLQRHQQSGACSGIPKRKAPIDPVTSDAKRPKLDKQTHEELCLGTFDVRLIQPTNSASKDLTIFLESSKDELIHIVNEAVQHHRGSKWYLNVLCKMTRRVSEAKEETCSAFFRSKCQTTLVDENPDMKEAFKKVLSSFEEFEGRGSGWVIEAIQCIKVKTAAYQPLSAASYIPLPKKLPRKHAAGKQLLAEVRLPAGIRQ